MWEDPIVKETRELRASYAAKCNNDADTIFEDLIKRQKISKRKGVSMPPRHPRKEMRAA